MNEIWKPLKGYEETHEISTYGRCRRLKDLGHNNRYRKGTYLKASIKKCLSSKNAKDRCYFNVFGKDIQPSQAVARTFIPNPENKPMVNHKDGNPLNNHISNLEWATASENVRHAYENNLNNVEKPIYVYGLGKFRSMTEASRAIGCNVSSLASAINRGKDTCKGYRFKRIERGDDLHG